MWKAFYLILEMNEFGDYEAKIEEAKKYTQRIGSVAQHWWLKPEVFWVSLPATTCFFTFLYFRLITSKFIYD